MKDRGEGGSFAQVTPRVEPECGARYSSGLAIYDEAFHRGRLMGRYWSATGQIEPERILRDRLGKRWNLPIDVFDLVIDGQSLNDNWHWLGVNGLEPSGSGQSHGVIELRHAVRPVQVRVHTEVDGTGFFTRWLEITNTSNRLAALSCVSPMAGLLYVLEGTIKMPQDFVGPEEAVFSVGHFASDIWADEGNFQWKAIPRATLRFESRRGQSGFGSPFFIVRSQITGECFVGQLAWSGNWAVELTCAEDFNAGGTVWLHFRAGPTAPGPMRVLLPGETIASPAMHIGCFHADLDGCVHKLHEHLRRSVLPASPAGRAQLVEYTTWGWVEHEVGEKQLMQEVDIASDVGCEVFVVDAGWFGNVGSEWHSTVGDWHPGNRLPNGLQPVFEYARSKGMLCGLWMEPERAGTESQTYKDHPGWLLMRGGEPVRGALDLTKPEVASWVESEIIRLIETHKLDLFRLDYNIEVWAGGENVRDQFIENTLWRHYEVLYGIFERIRKLFPDLVLQNCAAGGGRADLGMLKRFHNTSISDWWIPPRNLKVFNGTTLAVPPERCVVFFTVGHEGHRFGDFDFRLRVAVLGIPCVSTHSLTADELNPTLRQRYGHHIELYKKFIRPLLSESRVYHHAPVLHGRQPRGWCALEYVSADASRAVAGVFRLAGPSSAEYLFRPRGLDPSSRYAVTFDNSATTVQMQGIDLMRNGLIVRLGAPLTSELLLFQIT